MITEINSFLFNFQTQASLFAFSLGLSSLVIFFSIIPLAIARYSKGFTFEMISEPRVSPEENTSRWRKRAYWAHLNCFESFSIHSPAILLAILVNLKGIALPDFTVAIAFLHPLFRVLYIFSYLLNKVFLRAFFWGGAIGFSGVLYFESIRNFTQ